MLKSSGFNFVVASKQAFFTSRKENLNNCILLPPKENNSMDIDSQMVTLLHYEIMTEKLRGLPGELLFIYYYILLFFIYLRLLYLKVLIFELWNVSRGFSDKLYALRRGHKF